jgi:hypothetical protein
MHQKVQYINLFVWPGSFLAISLVKGDGAIPVAQTQAPYVATLFSFVFLFIMTNDCSFTSVTRESVTQSM